LIRMFKKEKETSGVGLTPASGLRRNNTGLGFRSSVDKKAAMDLFAKR
jgi:hypothetical protein